MKQTNRSQVANNSSISSKRTNFAKMEKKTTLIFRQEKICLKFELMLWFKLRNKMW